MKVLFFASLRERVGEDALTVSPPATVDTVDALTTWLSSQYPSVEHALCMTPLYGVAVNEMMAQTDSKISEDDTVAYFPPVTGG